MDGNGCPNVDEAWLLGWSVHHLELAADFTHLTFCNDDLQLFTSRSKKELVRSEPGEELGQVETIYIGQRGPHRLALTTHDKSKLLRRKGAPPSESVYAPVWKANGWDGADPVRRVEVRAAGKALKLRPAKGSTAAPIDMTRAGELRSRPPPDCSRRAQAERLRRAERAAAGAVAHLVALLGGDFNEEQVAVVVDQLLRHPQFLFGTLLTGESGEWRRVPDVGITSD